MDRLRPAPATRQRAVLYLRQSVAREDSISLELQEHEGRAYAERRGYDVIAVESDPGISGRTWKRPAVLRVMEMVENHEVDVIVLWKWSRLSRSRLDWAVAADKVQTAGGRIESATEPLDTTTSTGRLARGMLTEFAAFESERIGDVWKESHARRIRNGMPANGKPRFGYLYSQGEGFSPDPLTGPVLAELYRSYISGKSVYSLVKELNDGTVRPVRGYGISTDGLWSDRTLRRVLDSGFGAGFITANGEQFPGAHEAVIDPMEWAAYREARELRRTLGRGERSEYLLSGLVRCICGSSMTAGQFGAGRVAKYRCKAAHEKRTHAGGYVTAAFVERFVMAWVVECKITILEGIARKQDERPKLKAIADPSIAARRRIAAVAARIDALGERAVTLGMPTDSYQRILAPLEAEMAALNAQLLSVEVRSSKPDSLVIPNLIDRWNDLEVAERREFLRALIKYVEVTPGRPRGTFSIEPR